MRKFTAIFTAAALLAAMSTAFTGCSGEQGASDVSGAQSGAESSDTSINSDSGNSGGSGKHIGEIRDISSVELVKELKLGWNIGNTLDGGSASDKGKTPTEIETAWGNPVITKELIDMVKNEGFNVLRVPVTWDWSTGEGPDYTISEAWMDRVEEVVNYGLDNDMYVILNIHHETWHDPYEDKYEEISDRLKKVWTQIGTRFKDYDEHLIFEGMNEPRQRNTPNEWNGGDAEGREVVNKLDADFVETIRSLGGNNAKRHLMIPGYAASSTPDALKAIRVPENDDKIIVSVHAYIPYGFALQDGGTDKFYSSKPAMTADIDNLAATLKELFLDKGQAVIIGEFGAVNRYNDDCRINWAKYYITTMHNIGVPCVVWDNNAHYGAGELFGLLNRKAMVWSSQELVDAMVAAANGEYTIDEIKAESEELLKNLSADKEAA